MSQQGRLVDIESALETLTGNTGGPVSPSDGNINIVGEGTVTVEGNPGTSTLTIVPTAGGYPITPYVVGPAGQAGYQTIQSALDAANAAKISTGIPQSVYVYPGTYVENLTFYTNITVVGVMAQVDSEVFIIDGLHQLPDDEQFCVYGAWFKGDSAIFNGTPGGTTQINHFNCIYELRQNGYTFDIDGYSGQINLFDTLQWDGGGNNGFVYNPTGGCRVFMISGGVGLTKNSNAEATISGLSLINNIFFGIKLKFVGDANVQLNMGDLFLETITLEDNATVDIANSYLLNGTSQSVVHNSSNILNLSCISINSTAATVIDGSGSGILSMAGVSFLANSTISSSLTINGGNIYSGTYKSDYTDHSVLLGQGAVEDIIASNVGTDGQVFLGATGADPAFSTLTSTGGTIDFTLGPNSLNLETSSEIATSYDTDSGTAIPAAGVLTIAGTGGIATSGAGSTVTIDGSAISSVSLSPYIVGTTGTSDFSTIQGAIDQAVLDGASVTSQANIYIKPGTYNENPILSDGINLIGFTSSGSMDSVINPPVLNNYGSVVITGTISLDTGLAKIYNLNIAPGTAEDYISFTSGTSASLVVKGCFFQNSSSSEPLITISDQTAAQLIIDGCTFRSTFSSLISFDSAETNSITLTMVNTPVEFSTTTTVESNSTLVLHTDNCRLTSTFTIQASAAATFNFRNSYLNTISTDDFITASSNTLSSSLFDKCISTGDLSFSLSTQTSNITFKDCVTGLISFDSTIDYAKINCSEYKNRIATLVQKGVSAAGSVIGYFGCDWYQKQAAAQTTDATITTLASVTLNEEESITLKGTISAAQSDHTNAIGGDFLIIARRQAAGNVTLVGTATLNVQSSSAATFTADVDTGTQTVRIRVTGVAATTYNWVTTYQYQKILTDA